MMQNASPARLAAYILSIYLFECLLHAPVLACAAAQSQEEEGNQARQKLQALLARKQESANKLELLQQELAMMQNFNPAELAALEKDVGKLVAEAAAAESKKAALEMQVSVILQVEFICRRVWGSKALFQTSGCMQLILQRADLVQWQYELAIMHNLNNSPIVL